MSRIDDQDIQHPAAAAATPLEINSSVFEEASESRVEATAPVAEAALAQTELTTAPEFTAVLSLLPVDDGLNAVRVYLNLLLSKCTTLTSQRNKASSEIESFKVQAKQSSSVCQRLLGLSRTLEAQHKAALTLRSEAARAEQDRRQQLNDGFQESIKVMTAKIEAADEMRRKSAERNQKLTADLQHFLKVYEERQAEDAADIKDATERAAALKQALEESAEAVESVRTSSHTLIDEIQASSAREEVIRAELAEYAAKFESFQSSLSDTNERFATYKLNMAALNKEALRLQKENGALQIAEAGGKGSAALKQLQAEKQADEAELASLQAKKGRLEAVHAALKGQLQASASISSSSSVRADVVERASSH